MASRLEQLQAMLAKSPSDQFLRYGVAMELAKQGDTDAAVEAFRSLMADSTPHVPSFLMAAQQLVTARRIADARAVLRDGIEAARAQGNPHAASEMSELLANLGAVLE